ncbi:MAG TPA: hypothetical protein VL979_15260 [Solirubrobacteraceae bacterium]|nr:hypothetical protein [Solirubrobacteraceae bacterium]
MTDPSTNETENQLHAFQPAHRKATWWLAAIVGFLALLLATPAIGHAEESNPNNYNCLGALAAGEPEEGSEEQQVKYHFYCDGPITGYQLQAQVPLTGIAGQPALTANATGKGLSDTFSCQGEVPGYALNCVGLAKEGYETIAGQFAIGTKLCREPRVDPLLTVTYAYLEKGAVTQAIAGPFDLGRPAGCPKDAQSGYDRLNPKPEAARKKKPSKKKHKQASSKAKAPSAER